MGTFELSPRKVMKPSVMGLLEVSHVKTLGVDCLPHDDVLFFLVQWVVGLRMCQLADLSWELKGNAQHW